MEAGLSTAWRQLRLEGKAVSYASAYDEKNIEDLNKAALHDPLTGTSNRLCIESKLGRYRGGKALLKTSLGVLFIDIEHFKKVNDKFGHEAGDLVLKMVAKTRSIMRAYNLIALGRRRVSVDHHSYRW